MARYIDGSVVHYLEDAASGSPTPGGGSASALAGAIGTAMAAMAANFTAGRKKFAQVEGVVRECLDALAAARGRLLAAVDADVEAYAGVGAAYGLPKGTDAEKSARRAAIAEALREAMGPPLATLRACADALATTARLAPVANPNLITDVGVAAHLVRAALEGAALNVLINVNALGGAEGAAAAREEMASLLARGRADAASAIEAVERALAG